MALTVSISANAAIVRIRYSLVKMPSLSDWGIFVDNRAGMRSVLYAVNRTSAFFQQHV